MQKQAALWGALVGCGLGLSAEAGATPIRIVDNQTGNISIIDKAEAQKIFMVDYKLTYISNKKKWSKVPPKGYDYIDTVLTRYGIVSAWSNIDSYDVMVGLFGLDGKLKWKVDLGNIRYNFGLGVVNADRFLRYRYLEGEPFMSRGGNINLTNGKKIENDADVIGEYKNLILLQGDFQELPTDIDEMFLHYKENALETTNMFVINMSEKKDFSPKSFDTPFRKSCVGYQPPAEKLLAPYYAKSEIIDKINKKNHYYTENIVRGEYIYAHRADHCGKFTYRFHWTDLKHPGPVILEGWQ